jgi:DNA polymerase-3 subunit epsilon
VLVAHNAAFDYGFLAAEARRAGVKLPVRQRLCTLALSRRLGLDVPNHRLGTLARYWGVPQRLAHDAYDDAHVLSGVFAHSMGLAAQLGMPLCPWSPATGTPARLPTPRRSSRHPARGATPVPSVPGNRCGKG